MNITKPISTEVEVTTASTVNDSKLVRIYASANTLIQMTNGETSEIYGSFTIPAGGVEVVEKAVLDTITANTTVYCTPVAYKS